MRRSLSFLMFLAAACGDGASGGDGGPQRPAPPTDPALAEATGLGREMFTVMDQVVAYKVAHAGTWPTDLPALGVDSLTRTTVRRLTFPDRVPTMVVAFRRGEGHQVLSCTGTNLILEESMLSGGAFDLTCALAAGGTKTFRIGG